MAKPPSKKTFFIIGLVLWLSVVLYYTGRPLPLPFRAQIRPGVLYYRRIHLQPNLMIAHILVIDLSTPGLRFLVTPGDPGAGQPLLAQTTSDFLKTNGLLAAINGDGYTPWYFHNLLDYYPHAGDPVTPNGLAASDGLIYAPASAEPTLYISSMNQVSFGHPTGSIQNAISGDRMIVIDGQPLEDLDEDRLAPRTAIGLDAHGNRLIWIVIDGRQPAYSQGVSMAELAELLEYYGATEAMSMDGGGSSTMVIGGWWGARVMNSPIEAYLPGKERPVANHLGIWLP